MQIASIPNDRLRAILLGPDGEEQPHISRLSWLYSMIQTCRELSVNIEGGVARIDMDDPDAHAMMIGEVTDLLDALQALIVETTVHQSCEDFLAAI